MKAGVGSSGSAVAGRGGEASSKAKTIAARKRASMTLDSMLHGAALAEQERLAIVDDAPVDADPTDLAGEPSILDFGAAVHDHLQPGIFGHLRRFVVADTTLHPHHLGADGNGFAHDLRCGIGSAEHVDHIDRLLDVG